MLIIHESILAWTGNGLNIEAIVNDFYRRARVLEIIIRLDDPFFFNEWRTSLYSTEDETNLAAITVYNRYYLYMYYTKV